MTPRAGDHVTHQGLPCKVLAVTYREGGLCRLERPDGSVVEDVRVETPTSSEVVESMHG